MTQMSAASCCHRSSALIPLTFGTTSCTVLGTGSRNNVQRNGIFTNIDVLINGSWRNRRTIATYCRTPRNRFLPVFRRNHAQTAGFLLKPATSGRSFVADYLYYMDTGGVVNATSSALSIPGLPQRRRKRRQRNCTHGRQITGPVICLRAYAGRCSQAPAMPTKTSKIGGPSAGRGRARCAGTTA